jgi:adenylate cyclase
MAATGREARRWPRLSLAGLTAGVVAALAATLALTWVLFTTSSRRAIITASQELHRSIATRVGDLVDAPLADAQLVVETLATELAVEAWPAAASGPDRPLTLRTAPVAQPDQLGVEDLRIGMRLVASMRAHPALSELTITLAGERDGASTGAREGVGAAPRQLAVTRGQDASLLLQVSTGAGPGWRARTFTIEPGAWVPSRPPPGAAEHPAPAATEHPSFTTPMLPELSGVTLWTDLSYAQLDADLPEARRRTQVSALRAIQRADGPALGVVRASVSSDRVDALTRLAPGDAGGGAGHRVFLCDLWGRVVSRAHATDQRALLDHDGRPSPDGDLRVVGDDVPAEIAAAIAVTRLPEVEPGSPRTARVRAGGRTYLAAFTALPGRRAQGWLVGVVVPESAVLGQLEQARQRTLAIGAISAALALALAWLGVRALRRALARVTRCANELERFEFGSAEQRSAFEDVDLALRGLDRAKTALRALQKYAPIELVRELHRDGKEPSLGGSLRDVTVLFTDIEGFTASAESQSPDELADRLGRTFAAMTEVIHGHRGTVDKFIGDAVMALWNAPTAVDDHAAAACRAALACQRALDALRAAEPVGLAPWRTRIGIHRDLVAVGHYGAPTRMSYTALGDGVNLAARLEGLNKQYGTRVLVSATVRDAAGDDVLFRHIDRVAVKGRRNAIDVYELLEDTSINHARARRYELALHAYVAGDFAAAAAMFGRARDDAPSRRMAERCRRLAAAPRPAGWDGVHVADEK